MELTRYVESVARDLGAAAEGAGPEVAAAAERMSFALAPSMRLALLEALGAASAEIGAELPPGSAVEIRLKGRDPEFVVTLAPAEGVGEPPAPPPPPAPPAPGTEGEEGTARLTLRLPDSLKTRVEDAAAREGLSVNAWLVRAVADAVDDGRGPTRPSRGPGRSVGRRLTGWAG